MLSLKMQIIEMVSLIPTGKVAYYGQIGDMLGIYFDNFVRGQVVGWMLSGMSPEECDTFPWHRVIAKTGQIASLKLGYKGQMQIKMLLGEGVKFVDNSYVDMTMYGIDIKDMKKYAKD
jgi:methylated-DNA-protein-cysteine methyltransferase related protein